MIKLTKSSNVIRLIVCTLTALFVSLSFMGCPMPVDPVSPDVDITDSGSTTVDSSDYKDFYFFVAGLSSPIESSVVTKNRNYTDKLKNLYATDVSYTGIDELDNLKAHIKQEIMKPENCGRVNFITPAMTEEMFDRELQSLWADIDANYQTYNYIQIFWREEHYGRNYEIEILNFKM